MFQKFFIRLAFMIEMVAFTSTLFGGIEEARTLSFQGRFKSALNQLHSGPAEDVERALIYFELGKLDEAWPLLRNAQKNMPKNGDLSLDQILLHMNLGRIFFAQGDTYLAGFYWGKVFGHQNKHPGPFFALNCAYLSRLHSQLGDMETARSMAKQAESLLKPEADPKIKLNTNAQLGAFYEENFNFDLALIFFKRAHQLAVNSFGDNHYQTLLQKVNIARLDKGEQSSLRQLKLALDAILEAPHMVQAELSEALAIEALEKHDLKNALQFAESAAAIRKKQRGPEDMSQVASEMLLSRVLFAKGAFTEGLIHVRRAREQLERNFEKNRIKWATAVMQEGQILNALGERAQGQTLCAEAVKVFEEYFGEDNIFVLSAKIDPDLSVKELETIQRQIRQAQGAQHPATIRATYNLAQARLREGDTQGALEQFKVLDSIKQSISPDLRVDILTGLARCQGKSRDWQVLTETLDNLQKIEVSIQQQMILSEDPDQVAYAVQAQMRFKRLFTEVSQGIDEYPPLAWRLLYAALRYNTLAADLTIARNQLIQKLSGSASDAYDRLKIINTEISNWGLKIAAGNFSQGAQSHIEKLQGEQRRILQQLYDSVKDHDLWHLTGEPLNVGLGRDQVLLCFLTTGVGYGVFMADSQHIAYQDLGSKQEIDRDINRVRKELVGRNRKGFLDAGEALMMRLPFLRNMRGKKILVQPDGDLYLIPLEVLPINDAFMVEYNTFVYLTHGLSPAPFAQRERGSDDFLIFADPDFGNSNQPNAWSQLPATGEEARNIVSSWLNRVSQFQGKRANEHTLKTCDSPRFLHIATHGFFRGASSNNGSVWNDVTTLVNSGLILADANIGGKDGEDGVFTALEASQLRLKGTELVVLSMCRGSQGTIVEGLGVYGLQYAFQAAGARGTVAGLWPVPDKDASQLIQDLYIGLRSFQSGDRALAEAKRKMIEQLRQKGQYPDPFRWGCFIYSGFHTK